jgi:hypothetical protein
VRLGLLRGPPVEDSVQEHKVRIQVIERPPQAAAARSS